MSLAGHRDVGQRSRAERKAEGQARRRDGKTGASLPEVVAEAELDRLIVLALVDVERAVVIGDVFGVGHGKIFVAEVERQVLSLDAIASMLAGKAPKKIIIVPDRIVNVVI